MQASYPDFPTRKSLRAPKYEYRDSLRYFLTLCTWHRQQLFGHKSNGLVFLDPLGEKITNILFAENDHYRGILHLESFAVMPDHIHLLITLEQDPSPVSIPEYIDRLKTFIMRNIRPGIEAGIYPRYRGKLWQRSFYDHVVRNEKDYEAIIEYIRENPRKDFDRALECGEFVLSPKS